MADLIRGLPFALPGSRRYRSWKKQQDRKDRRFDRHVYSGVEIFTRSEGFVDEAFLSTDEAYTLSKGTILAAPGDPVGLLLDGRYRLERGAEVLSDTGAPYASLPTEFAASGASITVSVVGGKVRGEVNTEGSNLRVHVTFTAEVGKFYEINASQNSNFGSRYNAFLGADPVDISLASGEQESRLVVKATGTTVLIRSYPRSSGVTQLVGDFVEFESFSIRELPGNHRTQSNSALRGSFGKAPKDVRNLLTETENLAASVWSKVGTVTVTDIGDGAFRVNNFVAATGDRLTQTKTISPATVSGQLELKGEGADIGKIVTFTMKRVGGTFAGGTVNVTLTGEWQPVDASFTMLSDNTGVSWSIVSPASNSAAAPLVRFPQVELGGTPTNYQRVRASNLDVTEEGVTSHDFIRHNGVDDNVPATVPAITDGVLIVAGRDRTWVQEGYNAPGSHALNTGAVSGYPGWADVTGLDQVAVTLKDGPMTESEITREVARMQALGGGPKVVAFAPTGSLANWFLGLGLHVLDVGDWDVSGVTSFYVFAYDNNLTTLDVSLWNTAAVTNFSYFASINNLTTLDVSLWNTAAVTNFASFGRENNLTTLDVSSWNTAAVTSFERFARTNALTTLDVSGWNVGSVTDFSYFAQSNALTTLDVSLWNTAAVTSFAAFAFDNALTTLDVSSWNTAAVTSFSNFARDNALTTLDVSGWSTNCLEWTNFCVLNALTAAALDGILVMIAAQGTSNGTFSTSGALMNAPTATGEAAIDTLRGRGWTVTVPGGY